MAPPKHRIYAHEEVRKKWMKYYNDQIEDILSSVTEDCNFLPEFESHNAEIEEEDKELQKIIAEIRREGDLLSDEKMKQEADLLEHNIACVFEIRNAT